MPTEKQQVILDEMKHLEQEVGVKPTVRSLADRLESRKHEAERFSDDEVRGLLERLEESGHVRQIEGEGGEQRYELAPTEA